MGKRKTRMFLQPSTSYRGVSKNGSVASSNSFLYLKFTLKYQEKENLNKINEERKPKKDAIYDNSTKDEAACSRDLNRSRRLKDTSKKTVEILL